MTRTAFYSNTEMLERKRRSRFKRIAAYFRGLYAEMEQEGELPYRLTRLGAWAPSRAHHVYYFFRKLDVSRYSLFIDLGSGDGIVACLAGLFTHSVGIEIDPRLCRIASKAASDLNLRGSVSFICGDYRMQNVEQGDCLYVYPEKPLASLEALLNNWQGIILVYGHHFPPARFITLASVKCGREQITAYRNPSSPRRPGLSR